MRFTSIFVAAGAMLAVAAMAPAATITLTDVDGDPTSVGVAPGGTFQLRTSVQLETNEQALGVTFKLGASQSGIFTIVGRTVAPETPFTFPITANPAAAGASPGLNPTNGTDLGSYTSSGTYSSATYDLYTYILQVAPDAPRATYVIQAVGAEYADGFFDTYAAGSTTYSVAVPEPIVISGLAVPACSLLFRRRAALRA